MGETTPGGEKTNLAGRDEPRQLRPCADPEGLPAARIQAPSPPSKHITLSVLPGSPAESHIGEALAG